MSIKNRAEKERKKFLRQLSKAGDLSILFFDYAQSYARKLEKQKAMHYQRFLAEKERKQEEHKQFLDKTEGRAAHLAARAKREAAYRASRAAREARRG